MRSPGLQTRLTLLLLMAALAGGLANAALSNWPAMQNMAALIGGALILLALLIWLAGLMLAPLRRLLRALEGSVLSYRDGDFSMSLAAPGRDQPPELAELLRLHSELGLALREQRKQLAQRELLLDTVVQNTPVAMLLCNPQGIVSYANLAARQLLAKGRSLSGTTLSELLADAPPTLAAALQSQQDQLVSVLENEQEEQFHISQRSLLLQGQAHRLLLVRRMTRELSRQEVASWKRVIRVMSHELNNSLAPISSLAHSGAELARRGQIERLEGVFKSIGGRASHLHQFLSGYASFAKLPLPQPSPVLWPEFLAGLSAHCQFKLESAPPGEAGFFDAGQIEQALINLIKNAHEAGGPPEGVGLSLQWRGEALVMTITDHGPGMSEAVLAQALLPFYSTKRNAQGGGTGLGLALAREIAEAHGGHITLANRAGGGLAVSLFLPIPARD
ncbi:sensor histidine kinase [Roseateles oligotrophus]|uniref:histidine kinase n=1 Tax=Roseateles oligotrophus TaxID=1769250 RepID=A0ABT2YII2_9BURK|nr:ATP-binding protein [Roseateles oligotrophus]MCV2369861.1 ATP-binding protein [Roseateles oligotrophus]